MKFLFPIKSCPVIFIQSQYNSMTNSLYIYISLYIIKRFRRRRHRRRRVKNREGGEGGGGGGGGGVGGWRRPPKAWLF